MRWKLGLISIIGTVGAMLSLAPAGHAQSAHVQSAEEVLAQDAGEYARLTGVTPAEAARRLRAQEATVAATDRIRRRHRDRIAGISIEHRPMYRIVVLLTGEEPVRDQVIRAGGTRVPVLFRTGAGATQQQAVAAIRRHAATIRAEIPRSEGIGYDQRTGELVVLANTSGVDPAVIADGERRLAELTGVPVRIGLAAGEGRNSDAAGGARVEGISATSGRRTWCTTGFVVTDGTRNGVLTAAHCPDELTLLQPDGRQQVLSFVGGWGARHQDVQVNVSDEPLPPLFYADEAKQVARPLTGARGRDTMRAGDIACHRGESSGYGCAEVQLTDYAPPGELCGGPCDPTWITIQGPSCRAGDSGGPIFIGTTALGINKGGNWRPDGSCNFYYYMSTDFLPDGWSLLVDGLAADRRRAALPAARPPG